MRPCISAGDGATYNSTTGVMSARLSSDAGNLMDFGADGGLYTATDCPTVRQCFTEGNGIDYDPATGVIAARPSTDVGNNLVFGGDGGLFVPTGAATISVGCGLTGNGSAGLPVTPVVGSWPYPCDLEANAGRVYCDANGQLRSEPRPLATFVQNQQVLNPANLAVPAPQDTQVATHDLNIVNPDTCRQAFVMIEGEVDADFDLPAGNSSAALGISTDEMSFVFNKGATAALDVHIQGTKVVNATIPAGGALLFSLSITMGRGSGGATYNRIQSFLRAYVFVL
ncbi:hypothetical protein [Streptomyces sp. NPDC059063]|uniref:hypothetical protein n=1 Tax=Streptomyces sp. NPDC059063 TaxID=3346712 RepID=UPI0036A1AF93